jgi:predicted deacylase
MTSIKKTLQNAAPASRIKGRIPVGTTASGAEISIPYVALKGAEEGPCLWINGQVHGVEINGIFSALDFINEVAPAALRGSIVVTATANPLAFDSHRKTAPQDENDLDQTFPGRPGGFITERMAGALYPHVLECASAVINMHTNAPSFEGKPYGVYKQHPNGKVPERLLLDYIGGFRPSVTCLMSVLPGRGELLGNIDGALDYQLLAAGIPAFMIELGGGSRAEPHYIKQGLDGMRGVAQQMKMIPGTTPAPERQRKVTRRGHVTFNHGGLFRAFKQPGDLVKAGDLLGVVMDMHGEIVEKMSLPYDAIVIAIRRDPVVHTGERFVFVGQEWTDV